MLLLHSENVLVVWFHGQSSSISFHIICTSAPYRDIMPRNYKRQQLTDYGTPPPIHFQNAREAYRIVVLEALFHPTPWFADCEVLHTPTQYPAGRRSPRARSVLEDLNSLIEKYNRCWCRRYCNCKRHCDCRRYCNCRIYSKVLFPAILLGIFC